MFDYIQQFLFFATAAKLTVGEKIQQGSHVIDGFDRWWVAQY